MTFNLKYIFKIYDADNQMSQSCDQDKPHSISKIVFFDSLIGIYFFSPSFLNTLYKIKFLHIQKSTKQINGNLRLKRPS